jgi:hypothetical protein
MSTLKILLQVSKYRNSKNNPRWQSSPWLGLHCQAMLYEVRFFIFEHMVQEMSEMCFSKVEMKVLASGTVPAQQIE